ncbi:MAG: hypothetical protein WDZ80_00725 [Candidatus Paceibacterota bacterium]
MKNVAFLLFLSIFVLFVAFITVTEDIQLFPSSGSSDSEITTSTEEITEENKEEAEEVEDQVETSINTGVNNNQPSIPVVYYPESRKGVVQVSSVRKKGTDTSPRYMDLKVNLNEGELLNLTGWRIQSNTNYITVPQAVNFFNVSEPENNVESDIVVRDDHRIRIYIVYEGYYEDYEDEEPNDPEVDWDDLWRGNLRLNTCTGYLNEEYETRPDFPNSCPGPETSTYTHLSGECQNYIRRVRNCEIPDRSEVYSFRGEQGLSCRNFILNYFNPEACFNTNSGNQDFLEDEWRVWIEKDDVFDELHDRILLLNSKGEVIDEYIY